MTLPMARYENLIGILKEISNLTLLFFCLSYINRHWNSNRQCSSVWHWGFAKYPTPLVSVGSGSMGGSDPLEKYN